MSDAESGRGARVAMRLLLGGVFVAAGMLPVADLGAQGRAIAQAGPGLNSASSPAPSAAPGATPAAESPGAPAAAPARPQPDAGVLPLLQARAAELRLADTRFWHLLLHYEPNWFGGFTSQADGPGFFLAPRGQTDPSAELDATLAAFFSPAILEPGKMTAQCTFPARFRWLKEQLAFDPARLPEEECARFRAWQEALQPVSATFIFASFYFNNPASLFGHTLIRFDRKGRAESERLLDYAVNFAAIVPPDDNAITYAWKGLFGSYAGYFSLLPYYLKVREYSDLDSRDLWEYRLSLNADQLDWMVRHAWELGATYFDYYFFGENCSYHLLSLVEVADPRLRLRDRFPVWTLPTDTVRAIAEQPGLVSALAYRPSRGSQMEQKLAQLAPAERDMAVRFIARPAEEPAGFADLPPLSQALILDTASDYFQYKLGGDPEGDKELRAKLRSLLLRRSRLRATYDAEAFPPRSQPPESGHRSSRFSIALGETATGRAGTLDPSVDGGRRRAAFVELGWFMSFHDLLSDEHGYSPNTQILLGDLRARYYPERERAELERFAIVDGLSLFPLSPVLRQPSWKLHFAFERTHDRACRSCIPFVANPGIGLTLEGHALTRWIVYGLAEVDAQFDPAFLDGYRAGLAGRVGVLVDLTSRWRAHLEAAHSDYSAGQTGWTNRAALTQRITLDPNLELRVDGAYVESDRLSAYREFKAGVGWYF
jgi:hypothetical protein